MSSPERHTRFRIEWPIITGVFHGILFFRKEALENGLGSYYCFPVWLLIEVQEKALRLRKGVTGCA